MPKAKTTNRIKRIKKNKAIGIAVSQFNEFITRRLLAACEEELLRRGIDESKIITVHVPGAFELPLACLKLARQKNIAAVIALGAVIRGETFHFELVSENAARGILEVGLLTGKPVIFGVITTDTVEQAYARSRRKGANKGRDAAEAALQMMDAMSKIKGSL